MSNEEKKHKEKPTIMSKKKFKFISIEEGCKQIKSQNAMAARFATLTEKINRSAQLTQNQLPPHLPQKEYFISFIAFDENFITFL